MSGDRTMFPAAGLHLEGVLYLNRESSPSPGVVVCHPHPLYGGDMDNNVVCAIANSLHQSSMAVLRFNFRGVGRSEGDFGDGLGEQEDVRSALAFLSSQGGVDPDRIGLAGYSFGAGVALSVALAKSKLNALALVSPFISDEDWVRLANSSFPALVTSGSEDEYVSSHRLRRLSQTVNGTSVECEIFAGADHFWWGHEGDLARRIASFFGSKLCGQDPACQR